MTGSMYYTYFPHRYNSLVTGHRAKGIIAVCWVLSIIIGLTPMLGWNKFTEHPNNTCPPGLMECLFEEVVVMDYMVYFNFFACVLVPLLLMLAIYLRIFMAARHQLKLIELKAVHGEKSRSTLQKEIQAAKSLAIIVGLFAICWLPLHIINCFTLFCPQCARPPIWIIYVAIILSHGNSVVNPFIYAYRIREFRHTFRRIIRRHVLGRRELFESSGSARNSTHTSVCDSVRVKANGLSFDLFTEHSSSSSSCEISYPCSSHMTPAGGGQVSVSSPPLSVTIPHSHRVDPSLPQAIPLRKIQTPATGHPLQYGATHQSPVGPEMVGVKDRQDLSSDKVKSLFYKHKSCFTELTEVS